MDNNKNIVVAEGIIKKVFFESVENGYFIFSISNEVVPDSIKKYFKENISCVGYAFGRLKEEDYVRVEGELVEHDKYGYQIKISKLEKSLPQKEDALEKYLSSGVLPGIGKAIAKKIIEKFKGDTLRILESEPEKLATIKGINLEKAKKINEKFSEQKELRDILIELQGYGLTTGYATKIYKVYKENTLDIVKNKPYKICSDVYGIGFKTADDIAIKVGIEPNDMSRIKEGIKYILSKGANELGAVFLPRDMLIIETSKILNLNRELIEVGIEMLYKDREIVLEKLVDYNNNEHIIIFLNYYYYAESYVAKKILELSENCLEYTKKFNVLLENIQQENNLELAEEQVKAVKEAMVNGTLVITGGPGTGKTTIINIIIGMLENSGYEIKLCAPTGRAAKRMSETTGREAQTIHRLLGSKSNVESNNDDNIEESVKHLKKQTFEKNEDFPIEANVIIVDECSMIDISLMRNFLKAVASNTRLILVGDVDQLPSVGPGNVLRDIINSKCIKVVKLEQIFRQAQESTIVMNAHRINKGEYPVLNDTKSDFFFLSENEGINVNDTIINLVTKRLPKYLELEDSSKIQVLCPMRKSLTGVNNLNMMLQTAINPASVNKKEKVIGDTIFREGDKVMQIKNNYSLEWKIYKDNIAKNENLLDKGLGIFNGDEGLIQKIDIEQGKIQVLFDENKIVLYKFNNLDDLSLAYAITIHKSQGSEYKAVVIAIHSGPPMLFTRNLLYTAVTRAKELVVIVGKKNTIYQMVQNNDGVSRYTYLRERIIEMRDLE
ncbi:MAG: ATP-dependent RecD-like DNA helicase [bacterium]